MERNMESKVTNCDYKRIEINIDGSKYGINLQTNLEAEELVAIMHNAIMGIFPT